jgi:hypothetical protein
MPALNSLAGPFYQDEALARALGRITSRPKPDGGLLISCPWGVTSGANALFAAAQRAAFSTAIATRAIREGPRRAAEYSFVSPAHTARARNFSALQHQRKTIVLILANHALRALLRRRVLHHQRADELFRREIRYRHQQENGPAHR